MAARFRAERSSRLEPTFLSAWAAIFYLAQGAAYAVVGARASSLGGVTFGSEATALAFWLVLLGVVQAIVTVAGGLDPTGNTIAGTGSIFLAGLAVLAGGGFWAGTLFGVTAGLLWVLLPPRPIEERIDARLEAFFGSAPAPSAASGSEETPRPPPSPNAFRICLRCGASNPLAATACAACGSALPPVPR